MNRTETSDSQGFLASILGYADSLAARGRYGPASRAVRDGDHLFPERSRKARGT